MKTEVYSWRVSPEIKKNLERTARRRNLSVAQALEQATQDWVSKNSEPLEDEEEQRWLHQGVMKFAGTLESGDPNRSTGVSERVRQKLRKRYGR
jgi:predicted transcriptional regulator